MQNGTCFVVSPQVALERALSRYGYTPGPRDAQVEDMGFPGMASVFLSMTRARGGLPPTQHDFTVAALYDLGQRETPAIRARLGRTWISFVVQWHASVTLNDLFPLALWDVDADTRYGIDILVFEATDPTSWIPVGLALRVPGQAGEQYALRKNRRHASHGLVVRDVVCDRQEHPVGPFWLIAQDRLRRTVQDAADEVRTRDFWSAYRQGQHDALGDIGASEH